MNVDIRWTLSFPRTRWHPEKRRHHLILGNRGRPQGEFGVWRGL